MDADRRDWLAQARRGVLELCVLALIAREPHYGYQLATRLAALGHPLAAPEGTLYPLLRRLQRDGLVAATWQESRDGPPRKYYHLTADGQRLLHTQLAEWHALTHAVANLTHSQTAIANVTDAQATVDKEVPDAPAPWLTRSRPGPALPRPAPPPAGSPATP